MSETRTTATDDAASAANLLVHPLAGMAAMSALGMGMVAHAAGLWLGAMAGAAEAARRFDPQGDSAPDAAGRAEQATDPAIARARARVVELASARAARASVSAKADAPVPAKRGSERNVRIATDDLRQIGGIGPKLEQALNAMGFRTYAQIAALSEADIARIEEKMGFAGRVARDGWVSQARALAGKTVK